MSLPCRSSSSWNASLPQHLLGYTCPGASLQWQPHLFRASPPTWPSVWEGGTSSPLGSGAHAHLRRHCLRRNRHSRRTPPPPSVGHARR
eukprot:2615090-Rhodomonas_salina.1